MLLLSPIRVRLRETAHVTWDLGKTSACRVFVAKVLVKLPFGRAWKKWES
jgi:hypothetical protein